MRSLKAVRNWQQKMAGVSQSSARPGAIDWKQKMSAPAAPAPQGGMPQAAIDWKSKVGASGVAGQVGAGIGAGLGSMFGGMSQPAPKAPPPIMPTGAPPAPAPTPGNTMAGGPQAPQPDPMNAIATNGAQAPMAQNITHGMAQNFASQLAAQNSSGPRPMSLQQPTGVGPALQPAQNMQQQGAAAGGALADALMPQQNQRAPIMRAY